MNKAGISYFILLLSFFVPFGHSSNQNAPKKVVLLNSYHKGYKWTDEITRGVEDTLKDYNVDLNVEYLDTKRQFDEQCQEAFSQLLYLKHNKNNYDVVITSDDNAFNFMNKSGKDIFKDIPLVFCGVNYMKRSQLKNYEDVTGVVEQADISANITLIKKLHSQCKKILIITDNSTTGKRIQTEVNRFIDRSAGTIPEIEMLYDVTKDELTSFVKNVDSETVILMTLFIIDKNGQFFEYDESAELICENSSVPVYGVWDFSFGHGIVGGYLTSGYDQGKEAALKAIEVISGKNVNDIPVLYKSLTKLKLDYNLLREYNIPLDQIPENAEVVDMPVSLYTENKMLIWNTVLVFLLLILVLMIVSYGLVKSKDMQKKLRDGEEKLKIILDSIGDAVIATDEFGRIIRMNPVAEEYIGISYEHAKGKHLATLITLLDSETEEECECLAKRILNTGQIESLETCNILVGNNGMRRRISNSGAPILNDMQKIIGVVLVFRDISKEFEAQKALVSEHERFSTVLDALDALVYVADLENQSLLFMNEYGRKRWGDDYQGKKCFDVIYEGQVDKSYFDLNDHIVDDEGRPAKQYTWDLQVPASGEWYECHDEAIIWSDGTPVRLETAINITERKRAVEVMEKRVVALTQPLEDDSKIVFSDLFNIADIQKLQNEFSDAYGIASVIKDLDGNMLTKPSNFSEFCGVICQTRLGGKGCKDVEFLKEFHIDGAHVRRCFGGDLLCAGADIRVGGRHIANWRIGQVRVVEPDEEKIRTYAREIGEDEDVLLEKFINMPYMTIKEFEQLARLLCTLADQISDFAYQNIQQARFITERAKAEEERKKLEEKLYHSQKMDAIGQLAGGVAHDFNNMLGGILGAAQLLNNPKRNLDEKGKNYLNLIIKATQRASDLTAKLLAFGRKGKITSTEININSVIEDSLALLNRTVDKKIKISFINNAYNDSIVGDPSGIQNALINIGINASHAMENGGDVFFESKNTYLSKNYCDTCPFDIEPGEYVEIEIRDTGIGIPFEYMDQIFDPFFTTKEQGKGTGLGLSAVYGTIQDHSGAVTVYSETGVGTAFHLFLPCSSHVNVPREQLGEVISGTGRILLVDDEDIIRITGMCMLEDMGYDVVLAHNGEEALEIYEKQSDKIDLVLMDMIMPVMNGREAFYKLKDINPDCKIIISSGFTKNENLEELRKNGLNGFLKKPYIDVELSALIAEVLSVKTK